MPSHDKLPFLHSHPFPPLLYLEAAAGMVVLALYLLALLTHILPFDSIDRINTSLLTFVLFSLIGWIPLRWSPQVQRWRILMSYGFLIVTLLFQLSFVWSMLMITGLRISGLTEERVWQSTMSWVALSVLGVLSFWSAGVRLSHLDLDRWLEQMMPGALIFFGLFTSWVAIALQTLIQTLMVQDQKRRILMVSQRQSFEAQLNSLEQLQQRKDNFLSLCSHELRTPLGRMKILINLLKQKHPSLAQAEGAYLERLSCECDHQIKMVNDLLDMQRLRGKSPYLRPTQIELENWLNILIETLRHQLDPDHPWRIAFPVYLSTMPAFFSTDPCLLERILSEVMTNAWKYAAPNSVVITQVDLRSDQICIAIWNRVEQEPKDIERWFEGFYRGASSEHQIGSGLGLYLVKEMVQWLQGTIHTYYDQGCVVFSIGLPVSASMNRLPEPSQRVLLQANNGS